MSHNADEARHAMVEQQLRRRGIYDPRVLDAMATLPRHLFLSGPQSAFAYEDSALPSAEGQTISQPFMVAMMTQALDVHPGSRVLEIGTGTGYQTAILAQLARPGLVCSIERFAALSQAAAGHLAALQIANVHLAVGDGSLGWPGEPAAFDRILITAATPRLPEPLRAQLAPGGVLVAPIGGEKSQMLMRWVKTDGRMEGQNLLECRFVPLVGMHGFPNAPKS